jgi:hypothetical protein
MLARRARRSGSGVHRARAWERVDDLLEAFLLAACLGVAAPSEAQTPQAADAPGDASAAAAEPEEATPFVVGIDARYWRPWASGKLFITEGGNAGSATWIHLHDDLDLDPANGWDVGLVARYGRHRAHFTYAPLAFHGDARLDESVVYNGGLFPAGDRVRSDIQLDHYEVGYEFGILAEPETQVWGGLSAWIWTYDGKLDDQTSGLDRHRTFTHVYPVLTLSGLHRIDVLKLAAGGKLGGLAGDRYAIDAEASVGVRLFERADLDLGWRYERFAFHETTNEARMTFQGPFVRLSVDLWTRGLSKRR